MSPAAAPQPSELTTLSDETAGPDLENESRSAFNVRQSASPIVKKQLFQTPAAHSAKLPSRSRKSPAIPGYYRNDKISITKRYYRRQTSSVATPQVTRRAPGLDRSTTVKRPSVAMLNTTPGLRRKYITMTPDMWRNMQIEGLTAWLNSELVHASLSSSCRAMENISDSAVFLKQVSDMHHLYKSAEIQQVLAKVDKEIRELRFFVSKGILLSSHHEQRERLISLLLLNYHPSWLLVGLCVILGSNFGANLDDALKEAKHSTKSLDSDGIFMSVLEDAIKTHLLANDRPGIDVDRLSVADKRKTDSLKRDSYNGLVLQRVLHLVFLLDQAKQARDPVILTDPPLFRCDAEMTSSKDLIEQIGKDFLREQGDVVRFLAHRLYKVTYVTPLFERDSLTITNLSEDLRDGTKLCKLASIMARDKKLLANIRRVKNGMSGKDVLSSHLGNVSLALSRMQEYAITHLQRSFEWKASHQDVVNQKIEKMNSLLWQVAGLWLEIVVLDKGRLESELKAVQQEYRQAAKQPTTAVWSPNGGVIVSDVQPRVISPSRLTVYENCESESGRLLLRWCATVAGIYGVTVRDFCESFRDGAVLCLILHHYYPTLITADEITRVQQAELRSVTDFEAEAELVQRNFDLFTERSHSLGTIPSIPIRAEAGLAPSFVSSAKDDSFGRIMELLSSYLFRRLVMEKEGREDREYVQRFVVEEQLSKQKGDEVFPIDSSDWDISDKPQDDHELDIVGPCLRSDVIGEGGICADGLPDGESAQVRAVTNSSGDTEDFSARKGGEAELDCRSVLHQDRAISRQPRDLSLNPVLSTREDAAIVIIRYYRAANSRRQYLRKRDAAKNIQAGVRGFFVRERIAGQTGKTRALAQAEEYPLATKLYLKPWRAVSSTDYGLKAFSTESNPNAGFNPQESVIVIEQVSNLLPMLRQQMEKATHFANQMIEHERSQVMLPRQGSVQPDESIVTAAAIRDMRSNDCQGSTSTLRSFASGVFGVARSIALSFASEAESQRKSYVMALVGALQTAESAYEKEMRKAAARAEIERAEQYQRRDEATRFRQAQTDQEAAHRIAFQNDIASLGRSVSILNAKLDEGEKVIESLRDRDNDVEISSGGRYANLFGTELNDQLDDDTSMDVSQDTIDCPDLESIDNEIEEIRTTERVVELELDQVHADWENDLAATEAELRRWKVLLLKAVHHKAVQEFASHMKSADETRFGNLRRRQDLSLAISHLEREEKNASCEELIELQNLDDELREKSVLEISLSQCVPVLDTQLEEAEKVLESLQSRDNDVNIGTELQAIGGYRDNDVSIFVCQDTTNCPDLESIDNEIEEIRTTERVVELELDQVHADWENDLAATEAELRRWKVLLLKAVHHKAVQEFASHMKSAGETRFGNLRRRQDLSLAISHLEREEKNAYYEQLVELQNLDDELREKSLLEISLGHSVSVLNARLDEAENVIESLQCGDNDPSLDVSKGTNICPDLHSIDNEIQEIRITANVIELELDQLHADWEKDLAATAEQLRRGKVLLLKAGHHEAMYELRQKSLLETELGSAFPSKTTPSFEATDLGKRRLHSADEERPGVESGDESSRLAFNQLHAGMASSRKGALPGGMVSDVIPPHGTPSNLRSNLPKDLAIPAGNEAGRGIWSTPAAAGSSLLLMTPNSSRSKTLSCDDTRSLQPYTVGHSSRRVSASGESTEGIAGHIQSHALLEGDSFDPYSHRSRSASSLDKPVYRHAVVDSGPIRPLLEGLSASKDLQRSQELQQLSSQLDELSVGNASLDNIDTLIRNPESSRKLNAILRRISHATSQSLKSSDYSRQETSPKPEEASAANIIKTVFIVIRQCTGLATHTYLVELGISIVRDMAKNEFLVDSIFEVEDCFEMLVTCIQFYRDRERVLSAAAEALLLLSKYEYGQLLIRADEGNMKRIRGVYSILEVRLDRKARSEDRLKRADIIIDAVKRSREEGPTTVPFSHQIKMARGNTASFRSSDAQLANRYLSELINRFPI